MLGRKLAHYEVVDKIGEGGMGEVYRGRDTTLDREVALKVLPSQFLSQPERLARFEREAKVLASLNHTGIASIYGFHQEGEVRFLAMELARGQDLSQRLDQGPVPVEEALPLAAQIAEALEYAHEQNIVHRDLKPANVMVQEGSVKVLDFGLAKAFLGEGEGSDPTTTPSLLPTVTTGGTREGVVLGTAAYMAPEQARGHSVDRRADIWAFGCVLFEMLTGRRLFLGDTVSDTIASVLRADIDFDLLPSDTPPAVRLLLERCLDRDRNTRLRDIGEARIVLANPEASMAMRVVQGSASTESSSAKTPWAWFLGVFLVALVLGSLVDRLLLNPGSGDRLPEYAFEISDSEGQINLASLAVSPAGNRLVFSRRKASGAQILVLRDLNNLATLELPGTEGAQHPFWSPDGTEIGFSVGQSLYKIAIDGAVRRRVADFPGDLRGGTWNRDGMILVGLADGPIYGVSANGGAPDSVTTVDREWEINHVWPYFLPDGKHFVFLSDSDNDEGHRLYVHSLDGTERKIIRKNIRSAILVDPAGYLLINEDRQLLAYGFDFKNRDFDGTSILLEDGIQSIGANHMACFSISQTGVLICQQGSDAGILQKVFLDGFRRETVGHSERYRNPAISPDGRHIAYEIQVSGGERIVHVEDLERGVRTPVSRLGVMSDSPTWSHDGRYLYFGSGDGASTDFWQIFRKEISGGKLPTRLNRAGTRGSSLNLLDCSADGRYFLIAEDGGEGGMDLYLGALSGADSIQWRSWSDTPDREEFGRFSPDSRWIAYQSDESGQNEIYIAGVEAGPTGDRYLVSQSGGMDPAWGHDGKHVYYRTLSETLMRVPVTRTPNGLDIGVGEALFELHSPPTGYTRNAYDLDPTGEYILTWEQTAESFSVIRVRTGWR